MKNAVGSGGSPSPATEPSGSTSSRSDARISEKWRPCGLTRNRSPDRAYRDAEMIADPFVKAEPRRPAEGRGEIDALLPDIVRFHGSASPDVPSAGSSARAGAIISRGQ